MAKYEITAEPGSHAITMTATISGPRHLVFKAYTDPEAIPHWFGLDANTTKVDAMEPRHGGRWRFVETSPEGEVHAFRGVYHDVTPDERIVWTFEYEPWAGHILLEEMLFTAQGDKTRIDIRSVFQSVEDRDGMIATGMEEGANQGLNRLEQYVAGLK